MIDIIVIGLWLAILSVLVIALVLEVRDLNGRVADLTNELRGTATAHRGKIVDLMVEKGRQDV